MSRDIEVLALTDQDEFLRPWDEILSKGQFPYQLDSQLQQKDLQKDKALQLMGGKDLCVVEGDVCMSLNKVVQHRCVKSHFLNYFDYLENRDGVWWGFSLYSEVFYHVMLGAIDNQDFKGAVIFLGFDAKSLAILDILASFGFEDFVFLNCDEDQERINKASESLKGFIGTRLSMVDSTAFIQSQKEFSLCFVMEKNYEQQIIDDMSYFHFLSSRSIVFDIVGSNNFLFDEVAALGVDIVDFNSVSRSLEKVYSEKMSLFSKNLTSD